MPQQSDGVSGTGSSEGDPARGPSPRHVAIIMDGNGRWAEGRGLPRAAGHRAGVEAVRRTIRAAIELQIPFLTIFSFSSENWTRPKSEIIDLMGLLRRFLRQDLAELHANGVRILTIGERDRVDLDLLELIDDAVRITSANTALTLIIAFNYGARIELAKAAQKLAQDAMDGKVAIADITPALIDERLHTAGLPDPDLLIRTSGEHRISNFLLWQLAYTEFVFCEVHWPDFTKADLESAIAIYRQRDRRFGGLTAPRAAI